MPRLNFSICSGFAHDIGASSCQHAVEVSMINQRRWAGLTLLVVLSNTGCVTVAQTPPIVRPTGLASTRLVDLQLPRGTETMVGLVGREALRGSLERITADRLELRSKDSAGRSIVHSVDHAEITFVARVVGMSNRARGWLGAAIAAVASVPLGISMVGDMVVPAAIIGSLIGRGTGDSRAEVVYERQQLPSVR
jgi:hypothetical protein